MRFFAHTGSTPHAKLLSLSVETYGRWGPDSSRLVSDLARVKSDSAPEVVREGLRASYARRWFGMLSVTVQRAVFSAVSNPFGADLLAEPPGLQLSIDEVLDQHR